MYKTLVMLLPSMMYSFRVFASSLSRSRALSAIPNPPSTVVSFLTDVEGDISYFDRFVKRSKVLSVDEATGEIILLPNSHLVFGGDAVDRGGYDLACLERLNDLKRRYSENVHFVFGNRDINKLRISQELGPPGSSPTTPKHRGCYWLKGREIVGDPDLDNVPSDEVERLQWILQRTMGSPDAFRGRKRELEERGEDSSDAAVVESYRKECWPEGEMGRYLRQCDIAVNIGPLLFVHAALPKPPEVSEEFSGVNALPFLQNGNQGDGRGSKCGSVEQWIDELNIFGKREISNWSENIERFPMNDGQWSTQGGFQGGEFGGDLIQYGMGWNSKREKIPTVCYASWLSGGNPNVWEGEATATFMGEFFQNSTTPIKVVCCGHQPHGDTPLPMKFSGKNDEFVITCDTSYSGDVEYIGDDGIVNKGRSEVNWNGRGDHAVAEVLFSLDDKNDLVSTTVHGILADGETEYEYGIMDDSLVGYNATADDFGDDAIVSVDDKEVNDARQTWFVKGTIGGGRYIGTFAKGWKVWNKILKIKER